MKQRIAIAFRYGTELINYGARLKYETLYGNLEIIPRRHGTVSAGELKCAVLRKTWSEEGRSK